MIYSNPIVLSPNAAQRFWAKVEPVDGCWLWTGSTSNGYGRFVTGGSPEFASAHRVSYLLTGGHLVQGLVLDHICRNRRCVRPLHLEQVTQAENAQRAVLGLDGSPREQCPSGHKFAAQKPYYEPSRPMSPRCRICRREQDARRRAHKRAA